MDAGGSFDLPFDDEVLYLIRPSFEVEDDGFIQASRFDGKQRFYEQFLPALKQETIESWVESASSESLEDLFYPVEDRSDDGLDSDDGLENSDMPPNIPAPSLNATYEVPRSRPTSSRKQDSSDYPSTEQIIRRLNQARTRWDAPIVLRGTRSIGVNACPDTGSEHNILSKTIADQLGILDQLDSNRSSKFTIGSGKHVWSLGAVEMQLYFSKQPEVLLTCMFHVFESLIHPAILGGLFLRKTETLTTYRMQRLRQRVVTSTPYLQVMHIGNARERFRCYVNHEIVDAHADTGSDMDLVSKGFVQHSQRPAKSLQHPLPVQFADGSTGWVSQHIFAKFSANLQAPASQWGGKWFFVLDDLPCEILLGEDTLDELDAFNSETSFATEHPDAEGTHICTIRWLVGRERSFMQNIALLRPGKRKPESEGSGEDPEVSIAFNDTRLASVDARFRVWLGAMLAGAESTSNPSNLPTHINTTLLDSLDGWETNRRDKIKLGTIIPGGPADSLERDRRQIYESSRDIVLRALQKVSSGAGCQEEQPPQPDVDRSDEDEDTPAVSTDAAYRCTYEGCDAPPFQTHYLLNSHMNIHSDARIHFCPVENCPRGPGGHGFKRKNEMIRHGLAHTSPGYICPFCPDQQLKYPRPDNLQRHVRQHHMDKDRDDPVLRDVLNQRMEGGSRGGRRRLRL